MAEPGHWANQNEHQPLKPKQDPQTPAEPGFTLLVAGWWGGLGVMGGAAGVGTLGGLRQAADYQQMGKKFSTQYFSN